MNVHTLIARNLRKLRLERGLSQESLAFDAEVDLSYVSRLERSLENPSVDILAQLAEALRIEVGEFFTKPILGEKPPKPLPKGRRKGK